MQGEYFLFDLGATKIRFGVSKNRAALGKSAIVSTPKNYSDGVKLFRKFKTELLNGTCAGVAGGLPGPLNRQKNQLHKAPNLPSWEQKPLFRELQGLFRSKNIKFLNDTAIVGLGEAVYGAGKSFDNIIYYTVSTGVNGVWIVNKKIMPGVMGFETGHQIISESGKTMMDLTGGASLEKRYHKNPKEIIDKKVWKEVTDALAVGVHNSLLHWSSDLVIFGGGVAGRVSLSDLHKIVVSKMRIFSEVPPFRRAILGDLGGLYGALAHLRSDGLKK